MKRKRSGSSVRSQRVVRNVKHIPDSQIDFSDIPESTDEELGALAESAGPQVEWRNS
ncbi:MAG: hypothetical protein ACREIG_06160 [Nitrospiraceae bacterium]